MARTKKAVKDSTAKQDDKQTINNDSINTQDDNKDSLKTHSMTSQGKENNQEVAKIETRGRKPVNIDLDKLTEFASQKIDNKVIAEMLGISETTFYVKMSNDQEFKTAYEAGINNRKYNLEKALLKRAEGFEAEEIEEFKDDKGNIVKSKVTKKTYVPDSTSLIFALKNLYSDKYKEVVQTKTDINININQMQQLSNEDLAKIASANIIDADYSIE